MSLVPITLTLYKKNEPVRELRQTILPWGILEIAVDLQQEFESIETDQDGKIKSVEMETIKKLTDFVVYIFDDEVTADELKRGASIEDMLAVYNQIFEMVNQVMKKNPTIGQAVNRRRNLRKPAQ